MSNLKVPHDLSEIVSVYSPFVGVLVPKTGDQKLLAYLPVVPHRERVDQCFFRSVTLNSHIVVSSLVESFVLGQKQLQVRSCRVVNIFEIQDYSFIGRAQGIHTAVSFTLIVHAAFHRPSAR